MQNRAKSSLRSAKMGQSGTKLAASWAIWEPRAAKEAPRWASLVPSCQDLAARRHHRSVRLGIWRHFGSHWMNLKKCNTFSYDFDVHVYFGVPKFRLVFIDLMCSSPLLSWLAHALYCGLLRIIKQVTQRQNEQRAPKWPWATQRATQKPTYITGYSETKRPLNELQKVWLLFLITWK